MGTTVPTSRLKLCLVLGVFAVEFQLMLFADIQIKATIVAPLLGAQLLIGQAYHSYLVIGTQFHKMWAIYGHSELDFKSRSALCYR